MRVRFTEIDEYVAELERDAGGVANQRVRLTMTVTPTQLGLQRLEVIAGAKVLSAVPGHEDFDLVEFRRYCGDLWGQVAADEQVRAKAAGIVDELRARLDELGFVVAGGIYLEETRP